MRTEDKQVPIRIHHPLEIKVVRKSKTWDQWLEQWYSTQDLSDLISLLHNGFDTVLNEDYQPEQRIIFYLSIAEDCNFSSRLEESRKDIAKKAFEMLCLRFFKVDRFYGHRYFFEQRPIGLVKEMFMPLAYFFGYRKDGTFHDFASRNVFISNERTDDHRDKVALNFLKFFISFILEFRQIPDNSHYSESIRKRNREFNLWMSKTVDELKPWAVFVLLNFGKNKKLIELARKDRRILFILKDIEKEFEVDNGRGGYRKVRNHKDALQKDIEVSWIIERAIVVSGS